MESIVEILIYLLAVLGIIFTSISFYEMFDLNKYINKTYRIFSKDKVDTKEVNTIFEIYGFSDEEENKFIKDILNMESLKNISNKIIIKKED